MSLTDILKERYTQFILDEQPKVIAQSIKTDAGLLSQRNHSILHAEEKRAQAEDQLKHYQREHDLVRFVGEQASALHLETARYVEKLPADFRRSYEEAFATIQEHLDALNGAESEDIVVNLTMVAYRDTAQLYLPILWDERQKEILPGALYTRAIINATSIAHKLGAELSEPEDYKGIVRASILNVDADVACISIAELLNNTIDELRDAAVTIRPNAVLFSDSIADIVSNSEPGVDEETTLTGKRPSTTYSAAEAAKLWRAHEVQAGTVNGDELNYLMKIGRRISEGRVETDTEGTISQQSLDDYMTYCDIRKKLYSRKEQGMNAISGEDCRSLLGISNDQLRAYVGKRQLFTKNDQRISLNSVFTFTSKNTLRDGKWTPFKNRSPPQPRLDTQPTTKAKGHYMTTEEAAAQFNQSQKRILDLARQGELQIYHNGENRQYLFDRWELSKHFSEQDADAQDSTGL